MSTWQEVWLLRTRLHAADVTDRDLLPREALNPTRLIGDGARPPETKTSPVRDDEIF